MRKGRSLTKNVPEFLNRTPWYSDNKKPIDTSVQYNPSEDPKKEWYKRGLKTSESAIKYRPGACENCGAMTHKTKECTERPRRRGVKFNEKDIKPDEYVQDLGPLTYDAKRDNWNGYDVDDYQNVFDRYEYAETQKMKKLLSSSNMPSGEVGSSSSKVTENSNIHQMDVVDPDKDKEIEIIPKSDLRTTNALRSIRIREDTAKYLLNLDLESARYDPKSHAMREDPKSSIVQDYHGDRPLQTTGAAYQEFKDVEKFVWENIELGEEIQLEAMPTQVEQKRKTIIEAKKKKKLEISQKILEKYGISNDDKETYDEDGNDLVANKKLEEKNEDTSGLDMSDTTNVTTTTAKVLSKVMDEDLMKEIQKDVDAASLGHREKWGSCSIDGRPGYACCGETDRNAKCSEVVNNNNNNTNLDPDKINNALSPSDNEIIVKGDRKAINRKRKLEQSTEEQQ